MQNDQNSKYTGSPYFQSEIEDAEIVNDQPKPITPPGVAMFVRTQATGDKVYYRVGDELHWVKTPEVLKSLGGGFDDVVNLPNDEFKKLNTRVEAISMMNVSKYRQEKPKEEVEPKLEPKIEPQVESTEGVPHQNIPGLTSIIIPAYFNSYAIFHTTGNCIGSIREHTDKEKTPYEIILVLNGETGIKFANMQDSKADKVIPNEVNKGYATAVNQGIRISQGEYIVLMNNDVQVYDHWLEDLKECLVKGGLSMVAATPMYGEPYGRAVEAANRRESTMNMDIKDTITDFSDFSCVMMKKGFI